MLYSFFKKFFCCAFKKKKKQRHVIIPASYLILEKDGKVLLIRRFNTGFQDGKYSMIAGHVDEGETFTQAMIREAKEEANIDIRPGDLSVAHVLHRKSSVDGEERIDIFFKATAWVGELKNLEPHKCDEFLWANPNNVPANTIDYIRFVLGQLQKGITYSEYGW
jgi:8-oxo-dGTP pyrophosphatase MutT (NUDIX family)